MSAEESCQEARCEQPKTTDPGWDLTGPNDSDPSTTPSEVQPQGHDLPRHSCSCRNSNSRRRKIAEDVAASDASTQEMINCPCGGCWYCKFRRNGKKILINFDFKASVVLLAAN